MPRENIDYTFGDMFLLEKGKNKFLENVNKVIDFKKLEELLKKELPKETELGTSSYSYIILLKILLLETWYNLSDVGIEEQLNDRISFINFLGLSIKSNIPDHSTISRFRAKLLKKNLMEKILREINNQLEEFGLLIKTGVIVDATTVSSSRHPQKTIEVKEIAKDREEPEEEVIKTYSKDTDATWLVKGKKVVYGYKCHVATDKAGYMLGGIVTGANESDTKNLSKVLDKVDLEDEAEVLCDKGYSSKANDELLSEKELKNRIMKKAVKGKKLKESEKNYNKKISKVRYIIEQGFGLLKRWYGFGKMRYLGKAKSELELHLKMITFNVKKGVLKLTS